MSYAFDTMGRVWQKRIRPLVKDEKLAVYFEMLFEEMHSANHAVPDAKGVFKGDGINKHAGVTKAARRLEEHDKALDREEG